MVQLWPWAAIRSPRFRHNYFLNYYLYFRYIFFRYTKIIDFIKAFISFYVCVCVCNCVCHSTKQEGSLVQAAFRLLLLLYLLIAAGFVRAYAVCEGDCLALYRGPKLTGFNRGLPRPHTLRHRSVSTVESHSRPWITTHLSCVCVCAVEQIKGNELKQQRTEDKS